jgi:hypothetical protein
MKPKISKRLRGVLISVVLGKFSLRAVRAVLGGSVLYFGLAGCVGVHEPHPVGRTSTGAVMCDKCRTTWVSRGEAFGKLTRYSRQEVMVCEDCESAVAHWMKTGDLRHYCAHCKGHMTCSPARAR